MAVYPYPFQNVQEFVIPGTAHQLGTPNLFPMFYYDYTPQRRRPLEGVVYEIDTVLFDVYVILPESTSGLLLLSDGKG